LTKEKCTKQKPQEQLNIENQKTYEKPEQLKNLLTVNKNDYTNQSVFLDNQSGNWSLQRNLALPGPLPITIELGQFL
jgi:hypothetical protein